MTNFMRHITLVLIAFLAIGLLMPTIWAMSPYLVSTPKNMTVAPTTSKYLTDPWLSNQVAVLTTPSMAAFLGDNWMPYSTFNGTIYSNPYESMYPSVDIPHAAGTMLDVLQPGYDTMLQNASQPNAAIPLLVYAGNTAIPNPQLNGSTGKNIPHVVS
jgi:hypothetical protein